METGAPLLGLAKSIYYPLSYILVYNKIDEMIAAMISKQIDGILLDSYTASYYQARDKLKLLITVKKFELRRDVGILLSNDQEGLAECLRFYRSNIWRLVQTITSTYKVSILVTSCLNMTTLLHLRPVL